MEEEVAEKKTQDSPEASEPEAEAEAEAAAPERDPDAPDVGTYEGHISDDPVEPERDERGNEVDPGYQGPISPVQLSPEKASEPS